MKIEEVVPGLIRISLWRLDSLNVYILGDVLLDSGPRFSLKSLLAAVKSFTIRVHALTHAHFDHQGCSHTLCTLLDIPLWCGEGDRAAVESGDLSLVFPPSSVRMARLGQWLAGPGHPVSRSLHEEDKVGGFTVIEVPGHPSGHLAYWREMARALVIGDVLFHRNPVTFKRGLSEPSALQHSIPR